MPHSLAQNGGPIETFTHLKWSARGVCVDAGVGGGGGGSVVAWCVSNARTQTRACITTKNIHMLEMWTAADSSSRVRIKWQSATFANMMRACACACILIQIHIIYIHICVHYTRLCCPSVLYCMYNTEAVHASILCACFFARHLNNMYAVHSTIFLRYVHFG